MSDPTELMANAAAPSEHAASTPTRPPAEPRLPFGDVFFGSDGLRAGWSLLLFVALFFALFMAAGLLANRLQHRSAAHPQPAAAQSSHPGEPSSPISARLVLLNEGVAFACLALATWLMAKIERRPVSVFGVARQRWLRNFVAGLAWGVALLSLLILVLRATGLLVFDGRLLFGPSALRYAAIWLLGFLLVGLFEENLTRGYLQFTLARGLSGIYTWLFRTRHANPLGFWTAALILSFAFGFSHTANRGESPIGLLSAGLIGLALCFSLWRTGSLWWAIGFHASWDWAQSFLYGVADSGTMFQNHLFSTHPLGRPILSGGLTGPEGSLFILAIVALAAAIIVLTLPDAHSADTPAGARQPPLQ
jgi:uncharacterized protein